MAEGNDSTDLCISSETITCSICVENLSNPKILPCGHSLCLSPCLENLSRERPMQCPLCRKHFHCPPSGRIEDLPTNFALKDLLETAKQPQKTFVSEKGEDKLSWSFTASGNLCNEHENDSCDFFCNTCMAVVCPKCLLSTHKVGHHSIVAAEEYARARIDHLLTTLSTVQKIDLARFRDTTLSMRMLKQVGNYYQKMPRFTKMLERLTDQKRKVESLCSSLVEDLCQNDFGRVKEVKGVSDTVQKLNDDYDEVNDLYNEICRDVKRLKRVGLVAAAAVGFSFGLPFLPV